ncbi:MAG TPA: hypothetical protein VGB31_07305, partial [Myxococcota bacterium]
MEPDRITFLLASRQRLAGASRWHRWRHSNGEARRASAMPGSRLLRGNSEALEIVDSRRLLTPKCPSCKKESTYALWCPR